MVLILVGECCALLASESNPGARTMIIGIGKNE